MGEEGRGGDGRGGEGRGRMGEEGNELCSESACSDQCGSHGLKSSVSLEPPACVYYVRSFVFIMYVVIHVCRLLDSPMKKWVSS